MGCTVKSGINIHCRGDRTQILLCDTCPCRASEDLDILLVPPLERQYQTMELQLSFVYNHTPNTRVVLPLVSSKYPFLC